MGDPASYLGCRFSFDELGPGELLFIRRDISLRCGSIFLFASGRTRMRYAKPKFQAFIRATGNGGIYACRLGPLLHSERYFARHLRLFPGSLFSVESRGRCHRALGGEPQGLGGLSHFCRSYVESFGVNLLKSQEPKLHLNYLCYSLFLSTSGFHMELIKHDLT